MSSRSSRTDSAADDAILVGRVLRPHGVRGELKIAVESDVPDRFAPDRVLRLRHADGRVEKVAVVASRPQGDHLLLRLAEVADRDAAEALRDARLEVCREDVPPAPEGQWYHFELVGCRCHDARAGDLGTVTDLVDDGGGLLLTVSDGEREILVPFVHSMVTAVDPADQRIDLDLPDGLLETCSVSPSSSRS